MRKLPPKVASIIPILEREHGRGKNGFWLRDADIEAVNVLVAYYATGSKRVRDRVVVAARRGGHSLGAYAHAMAALAVRRNDATLVFRGLVALAIAGGAADDSSTTCYLAVLGNSARKLQANEDELFQQILPLVPPWAVSCIASIRAYLSRSPRSRRLAMGKVREEGKGETFNYVPPRR